jgi:hypothetical protein
MSSLLFPFILILVHSRRSACDISVPSKLFSFFVCSLGAPWIAVSVDNSLNGRLFPLVSRQGAEDDVTIMKTLANDADAKPPPSEFAARDAIFLLRLDDHNVGRGIASR